MAERRRGRTLLIGALALVGVGGATFGIAELTGADPSSVGTDPLNLAEAIRALGANNSLPETVVPSEGSSIEVLKVERRQDKGDEAAGDPRRADVYSYDYRNDTLYQSVVDLNSARVISTQTAQGVQLALSDTEQGRALQLALSDTQVRSQLNAAYQRVTGRPLVDPIGQLQAFALVFRAADNPGRNLGDATVCGRQRCAQILINTTDDVVVGVSPVVNLSTRTVYRNLTDLGG